LFEETDLKKLVEKDYLKKSARRNLPATHF